MKYKVVLENIKTVNELPDYWTVDDYKNLLTAFEVQDTAELKDSELKEYLFLAINDFDPQEAATIILTYKLSDILNTGQIDQLSHDMLKEKVAEEYSDIAMHENLFNINQFLFKAYNGKFPDTKASIISCSIEPLKSSGNTQLTKESALKALSNSLDEHHIIKRLFDEQLAGKKEFNSAENIIWQLTPKNASEYEIITSDYWLSKDDFMKYEFEAAVIPHSED